MVSKKNIKLTKESKSKKATKSSKSSYIQTVGRRRVATARVRIYPFQKGEIEVNGQPIEQYFPGKIYKTIYRLDLEAKMAIIQNFIRDLRRDEDLNKNLAKNELTKKLVGDGVNEVNITNEVDNEGKDKDENEDEKKSAFFPSE